MEGKINQEGILEIKRGLKMIAQNCKPGGMAVINNADEIIEPCGDSCPLFGEPVFEKQVDFQKTVAVFETEKAALEICQGRELRFDKFTDERPQEEPCQK